MRVNLVLSLIFSITAGGSPVRVALSVLPSLSFPGVSVQEDSCTGSLGDDFGGNQGEMDSSPVLPTSYQRGIGPLHGLDGSPADS